MNGEFQVFADRFFAGFEQRSVEDNWLLYKNKLLSLIDRFVPKRKVSSCTRSPWFNNMLKRMRNKKKRIFRRAKFTARIDHWSCYQKFNREFCTALSKAKKEFFDKTLPLLLRSNPRKFWSIINGTKTTHIQLIQSDVPVIQSECCNVLNNVFVTHFHKSTPTVFPHIPRTNFFPMDYIAIDAVGVERLIVNLKVSSSAGPDCISSKMLKCTQVYSALILSKLFQQSLQMSTLPSDWKIGKVVPVHKSGDVHSPIITAPYH